MLPIDLPPLSPDVNNDGDLSDWPDVVPRLPGDHVRTPTCVIDTPALSTTEKLLWVVLKGHCIGKKFCWPSNERIGRFLGIERRQASAVVNALARKGWVRIQPKTIHEPRRLYPVIPPDLGKKLHGGMQFSARDPGKNLQPETYKHKQINETLLTPTQRAVLHDPNPNVPFGDCEQGAFPPAPPHSGGDHPNSPESKPVDTLNDEYCGSVMVRNIVTFGCGRCPYFHPDPQTVWCTLPNPPTDLMRNDATCAKRRRK